MFTLIVDDLSSGPTQALLALHLAGMQASSPPEQCFALDLSGLQRPDVTVWTAWEGTRIAGVGALRRLSARQGEIKSMRTHPEYLRRGVGRRILAHIITESRAVGITRLSLETGSGDAFEPALALYRRHGFHNGPAFGDYHASAFNQFLHRDL